MVIIKTLPPGRELSRDYCANIVLDDSQTTAFELTNRIQYAKKEYNSDYSPRLKPGASRDKPRLCSPTARMLKAALRSRSIERRQQGQ
jgi:hypothetical protein